MRRRFSRMERLLLYDRAGGRCQLCGCPLDPGWHADHWHPWSKGGQTTTDNGAALCETCNLSKGARAVNLPFENNLTYGAGSEWQPREWQERCAQDFREFVKRGQLPARYLIYAGVGSGKTNMAAWLASDMLNRRIVQRVVFVCPNRSIRDSARMAFVQFGMHLVEWSNKEHGEHGEQRLYQGAAMTYQAIGHGAHFQRRLCSAAETMVIFDEIHHLGDKQDWGVGAVEAFADARVILGLSGTPYRSDNNKIPFVLYEECQENGILRFRPDFSYNLGKAIADSVCRVPVFNWYTADVRHGGRDLRLDEDTPLDLANQVLNTIVQPGQSARLGMLRQVLEVCEAEHHRLIIFVGGDSNSSTLASDDAQTHLPQELISLGVPPDKIVSVISSQKEAVKRIREFGRSDAKVLISVNMVSEGVDIPELTAACFLTSITAKATTTQRIGRVLRGVSRERPTAPIFMSMHPTYVELAREIEQEVKHEINLRPRRIERDWDGVAFEVRNRPNVVSVAAFEAGMTVNGKLFRQDRVDYVRNWLRVNGLPVNDGMVSMRLLMEGGGHA